MVVIQKLKTSHLVTGHAMLSLLVVWKVEMCCFELQKNEMTWRVHLGGALLHRCSRDSGVSTLPYPIVVESALFVEPKTWIRAVLTSRVNMKRCLLT
jgi:hypothetical protein